MFELLSFDASGTRSNEVSQFFVKNPSLSSVSYAGQLTKRDWYIMSMLWYGDMTFLVKVKLLPGRFEPTIAMD